MYLCKMYSISVAHMSKCMQVCDTHPDKTIYLFCTATTNEKGVHIDFIQYKTTKTIRAYRRSTIRVYEDVQHIHKHQF